MYPIGIFLTFLTYVLASTPLLVEHIACSTVHKPYALVGAHGILTLLGLLVAIVLACRAFIHVYAAVILIDCIALWARKYGIRTSSLPRFTSKEAFLVHAHFLRGTIMRSLCAFVDINAGYKIKLVSRPTLLSS